MPRGKNKLVEIPLSELIERRDLMRMAVMGRWSAVVQDAVFLEDDPPVRVVHEIVRVRGRDGAYALLRERMGLD